VIERQLNHCQQRFFVAILTIAPLVNRFIDQFVEES